MSTTLVDQIESSSTVAAATRLRATMAAVRVSFTWFGVRKSLTPAQKAVAAESFGAEMEFLSAGKKLLDTKHPALRAVTSIRGRVLSAWKGMTLPFPEPGIRLIKQQQVEEFDRLMHDLRDELNDAVEFLDEHFSELKAQARDRLGSLYNHADYPDTLKGLFAVEFDYPAVEPPDYLRQLSPALYEQERARVAARFDEAVRLAETAFTEEFAKLVGHLTERIRGDGGEKRIFRDSAVENLVEFFGRFRELNVRSSEDLDQLVAQAQQVVQGIVAQDLRDDGSLRRQVAAQLGAVQSALDGLMVDRPRRRILRNVEPEAS